MWWILAVALLVPVLLTIAFLLGRELNRTHAYHDQFSVVTRQHLYLFQGGRINEQLLEATKREFEDLLATEGAGAVEAKIEPGVHFIVQVKALTEIGTEEAGVVLERKLSERLTDDDFEQSWYWLDLAGGLRAMNREESLPQLLRCAEHSIEAPLAHLFAAETVSFLSFGGFAQRFGDPLGRAALRVLRSALEGLRCGLSPQLLAEARLGELIEQLWDQQPEQPDPLLVRCLVQCRRLTRRSLEHFTADLLEQEAESIGYQMSRLHALDSAIASYLDACTPVLLQQLRTATGSDAVDLLDALIDLRADTGAVVPARFLDDEFPHRRGLESLMWSCDPRATYFLCRLVEAGLECHRRPWFRPFGQTNANADPLLITAIRSLREHRTAEAEARLLEAATCDIADVRAVALASFGWSDPHDEGSVLDVLHNAKESRSLELRFAARTSLARLGQRESLQWFRERLTSEEPLLVHDAIRAISEEYLTWLWPDLDRLTESDNPELAYHAREAVHRLSEEAAWRQKRRD